MKTELKIILGLFLLIGLTVFAFSNKKWEQPKKNYEYTILNRWELPKVLEEVSGISWIGNNKVACIQDEEGVLFFYNIETSKIEKEVSFAGSGDYEGLTLFGNTVFVTTSDGDIYEITNFTEAKPTVKQYDTPFFKNSDIESVAADDKNNRLLLIPKFSPEVIIMMLFGPGVMHVLTAKSAIARYSISLEFPF